ncbi:MAG TPA: hypothetical protein VLT36_23180 [Candidatus Dormibacteraeota bacterium]|nr:hypothetical protein [Candidatus Dormibacteraeota bacterium]
MGTPDAIWFQAGLLRAGDGSRSVAWTDSAVAAEGGTEWALMDWGISGKIKIYDLMIYDLGKAMRTPDAEGGSRITFHASFCQWGF